MATNGKAKVLWHVGDELDGKKMEAIFEFRKRVEDLTRELKEEETDDEFVVQKFLNARQWNVDKAVDMFRHSLKFRRGEYSADELLAWRPPDRLVKWCPGGMFGQDKEGNPVAWLLAGRADFKSVYRLATKREHAKFRHWQLNVLIRQARIMSQASGRYCGQSTQVIDLATLGWSNLHLGMVRIFNECNRQVQEVYPELVRRIIIVNPPGIFNAIFAMCKPFLFQRLIDKIVVANGEPYAALSEHVAHEHIPKMYGGGGPDPDPTGAALVKRVAEQAVARAGCASEREYVAREAERRRAEGWTWGATVVDGLAPVALCGPVPAEDLREVEFDAAGAALAEIPAGKAEHVAVDVADAGSLLSWEFKGEGGDIGFRVTFAESGGGGGGGGGGGVGDAAAGGGVGPCPEEVLPVERVACHEVAEAGEHVCIKAGTYVLTFDNTSSWVSSRKVWHRVRVETPEPPPAAE